MIEAKLLGLGICGRLSGFIKDWMKGRSIWTSKDSRVRMRIGLPQGSPLSCSVANMAIVDLIVALEAAGIDLTNFADDITLAARSSNKEDTLLTQTAEVSATLTAGWSITTQWATASGAKLNAEKSATGIALPRNNMFEGKAWQQIVVPEIEATEECKILGVVHDRFSRGSKHIEHRLSVVKPRLRALRSLNQVSLKWIRKLYVGGIRPALLYGIEVFDTVAPTTIRKLETGQTETLRSLGRLREGTPAEKVRRLLRVPPIELVIMARWLIRDGELSRQEARRWIDEEWELRTSTLDLVKISSRDDAFWRLDRRRQGAILRGRADYILTQDPQDRKKACGHSRCHGKPKDVRHLLEDCATCSARRTQLKVALGFTPGLHKCLWPETDGLETLQIVADYLIAAKG